MEDLPATISVEKAAELLGISRSSAYQATRLYIASKGADGIPALRIGRRIVVPTASLMRLLGKSEDGGAA